MTFRRSPIRLTCDPSFAGPRGDCTATVTGYGTATRLRTEARRLGWQIDSRSGSRGDRCPAHRLPDTRGTVR